MAEENTRLELLQLDKNTGDNSNDTFTKRGNAEAIFNRQQPDYYFNFMDTLSFVLDPIFLMDSSSDNGEKTIDSWGTEFVWVKGAPGKHPTGDPEKLVIKDITNWEPFVKPPTLEDKDWSKAKEMAEAVDRSESYVACFCSGGLFERSHHLMSFEEALVNYLEYEEEVTALLRVIADWKIAYIRKIAEVAQPDAIFYHDDWGSKKNVFLPPEVWRRTIKPLTKEIIDVAHEVGMLFVMHSDCYCEPIALDMQEIGIDVWQGVIPENDIVAIQKATNGPNGPLAMIGGVDGPKLGLPGVTEEDVRAEVRRAVDTYCPGTRFFPALPNNKLYDDTLDAFLWDELAIYGRKWAQENPIEELLANQKS